MLPSLRLPCRPPGRQRRQATALETLTRKGRLLPAVIWLAKPTAHWLESPGTDRCLCSAPVVCASASGTTPNSTAVLPRTCVRNECKTSDAPAALM